MTLSPPIPRTRLDPGAVFGGMWLVLRTRWPRLLVLTLIASTPSAVVKLSPVPLIPPIPNSLPALSRWLIGHAEAIPFTIVALLVSAGAAWTTLQVQAGRAAGFGEAAGASLRALPLLLAFELAASWPFSLLQFLVAGGDFRPRMMDTYMYLALASLAYQIAWLALFGIITPTALAEGPRFSTAPRRAILLMNGGRWLFLLFCLAYGILDFGRLTLFRQIRASMRDQHTLWMAVRLANNAVFDGASVVCAVFVAAYYRELCRVRDGVAPGDVTGVFD